MDSGNSRDGCESNHTLGTAVQSKRISMRNNHLCTDMTNNKNENGTDPRTQGALDDFLNAKGPSSLTIETVVPTPDKTTSELSCLTSPDIVSLFPDPETYLKTPPLHSSPDFGGEQSNDKYAESQNLIWIKIQSLDVQNSTSFSIPVSLMLKREVEMQAAARTNKIGKERWTSSRVFRMWKSQCSRQQRVKESKVERGSQKHKMNNSEFHGEFFLRMTPELSLQNSNSSCRSFCWKPWLTRCIRAYYNYGNLRIPNECTGDDILLALEYFGILTASPDDFVFDSSHAYVRIQSWSRYFSHRADLAESLLEAYDDAEVEVSKKHTFRSEQNSRSQRRKTLVWILFREKERIAKDQYEHHVVEDVSFATTSKLGTSYHSSASIFRKLIVEETGGLYDLFTGVMDKERGETEIEMLSKEMPERMRKDFCEHLRQSLPPWALVRFDIDQVEFTMGREVGRMPSMEHRPVICIYQDQLNTSKTTFHEERKKCMINLNSLEESAGSDAITSSPLLRKRGKLMYADDGKVSKVITLRKKVNSIRKNISWNKLEKTEGERRSHDFSCRDSCNTAYAANKLNSIDLAPFNESQRTEKPITFVSMELGDLRSVTSFLSEPTIDDPESYREIYSMGGQAQLQAGNKRYNGGPPVLATAKQIVRERRGRVRQTSDFKQKGDSQLSTLSSSPLESSSSACEQKIHTPPRTTRILLSTPPCNSDPQTYFSQDNVSTNNDDKPEDIGEYTRTELKEKLNVTAESVVDEYDDENSESKFRKEPAELLFSWGQLLASVCEGVIPAPSSNVNSSSPIRRFTLSSSRSTASTVVSTDDEPEIIRGEGETVLTASGFVDKAKRLGTDLSDQLDELMKIAYNEQDHEESHPNSHNSLSPISEEIPNMLSIDTDENCTLTSCLTSSVVGKNRTPEKFENFRKMNSNRIAHECTSHPANATSKRDSVRLDSCIKHTWELRNRQEPPKSYLVKEKEGVATRQKATRKYSTKDCSSDSSSYGRIGLKNSEGDRVSLVRATYSLFNANDYSKENRYSRLENRFYS
mmetsp:Transcript_16737/g.38640  ORF Transcript_16737/g.38640 Transcript_16737/m.38640 type:complete len:1039 (+) Transcript_16737:309-3425(+)|eukprot:CAMPEP_0197188440 /NCGR_PEP_ID=MMETSP1423-20130617/17797_1 /TAXON_ID=476441 /ORGANISM="Pseudo-nitzschia heimii, Strain UNC1101" /LENGTH=1038 /DNA_ID=CAMNT_0042640267 /DNA_START=237 /DNA_END=3353 /DNA_ORIENTATION=+